MELRQLEHFVAVCEEQHFTRAAHRLRIAQSGLSASIKALEQDLGTPLLTRTTRRVRLTDAGRALLAEARRTLQSAEAAREAVAAVQGLVTGTLAVGTEQCMGIVEASELLAALRRRHPGVAVRMVQDGSDALFAGVRDGTLDLAFVVYDGSEEGATVRPVAREPLMLLCGPDHPLASAPSPVALTDLAGEDFVDLHRGWGARQAAEAAFAAVGVERGVAMQVNDVYTLLDLVHRGMGVAVVPRPVTRKVPARGLAAVPLDTAVTWNVGVALPTGGRLSPAARALLDGMEQHRPDPAPDAATGATAGPD
ncbi:LysR family transcriptional regulator [Streptomyces otsuchiensis]|uniref:LysR family transcriptional regulator n=1 Tax=Streptomyces otsuchiensis TaxID=2681388 RepID=UPI00103163E0|nr:LysR family transcriptional regulator [Streptomyces otsuchiensis]